MLIEIFGIKIEAVNLLFRVFTIQAAKLSQQGIGKANIGGEHKELPLYSLYHLRRICISLMDIYHNFWTNPFLSAPGYHQNWGQGCAVTDGVVEADFEAVQL